MQITDVQTVLLTGPSTNDSYLREADEDRSVAIIEVHTDTGVIGLGETYAGYFCPEVVPQIVDFFRPVLIGNNVDDIPALWSRMYHCGNYWCRVGLGAIVLSGIEAALWDLKGKLHEIPVYHMLSDVRHDSLPCYATGGPSNYPEAKLARKLDYYLSLGFRAVKLGVGSFTREEGHHLFADANESAQFEADKLDFIRRHAGNDIGIMLDGHMNEHPAELAWDLAAAKIVVQACENYGLLFFEEPMSYDDPLKYAELRNETSVPIAGGECLTTMTEWRPYLHTKAFDIGQPDASFNGGLNETMRLAAALEDRGRKIATHSWGAGGALMQNIHVAFACRNTAIVEVVADYGPLHSELIGDSFRMVDGDLLPPDTPGLGIVLD